MEHNRILIRYGEIFLKSEPVRKLYEKFLAENIKNHLKNAGMDFSLSRERGRFFLETDMIDEAVKEVSKVFGIVSFSPCTHVELSKLENFVTKHSEDLVKPNETFKVFVKRVGTHGFTSKELAARLGEIIINENKSKVDLFNPEKEIYVEVRNNDAYVYQKFMPGPGGMPTGTGGRVVCLLSGGIDSPVASWMIMKRGGRAIFTHFHSYPMTCSNSIEKAKDIVNVLDAYQFNSKLYLVPFLDVQKEILKANANRLAVVIYRRMMTRIAQKIAKEEHAQALVTGDSLGQVASQTLTNLQVVEEAAKIPIFRPLISWDKEDITGFSKRIGTYDISIRPHEDNCTLFAPKRNTTRAKISEVKEIEKEIDVNGLVKDAFEKSEVIHYAKREPMKKELA